MAFANQRRSEAWRERCVNCGTKVAWLNANEITVGAPVRQWDEVAIIDSNGRETGDVELKSKVIPMLLRGQGCPECQHLMAKMDASERHRYEVANAAYTKTLIDARKVHIVTTSVTVMIGSKVYELIDGYWYHQGVRVPTSEWTRLYQIFNASTAAATPSGAATSASPTGLPAWMRAAGITASTANLMSSGKPVKAPTKRQPFIDVTEVVMQFRKASRPEE